MSRSSCYYQAIPKNPYNLYLMDCIDRYYTRFPTYGILKMTVWLNRQGEEVNHKRVKRLMGKMCLKGLYPKKNTSKPNKKHKKYPYMLKGLKLISPNQVWCSDITYIRIGDGFIYLVAIMDWYSRYVLSWEVSNTLDSEFCKKALLKALEQGEPLIFNTDQGVQFTSELFTSILKSNNIGINMNGKGRVFDNIFVERLWRSFKYEEVYIKEYTTVIEAIDAIGIYFDRYNNERLHASLKYATPAEVHVLNY